MNIDHWPSFVDYGLNSRTKVIKTTLFFEVLIYLDLVILLHVHQGNCKKKKDNRKKQTILHIGGSKIVAQKKYKMVS